MLRSQKDFICTNYNYFLQAICCKVSIIHMNHPRNVNFELTFLNLYYMCFCFGRKTNIRLLQ